ncbi:hypothetical protein FB451DRAFT_1040097 [Mycena latifolia]|nr:hypothetical protein FB451DRAFT_1040097 [Mycena latifolia]
MVRADLSYLRVESGHQLAQKCKSRSSSAQRAQAVSRLCYAGAGHPICALPIELLALIFVHCLPERQQLSAPTAPLLLTRVCGDWRAIAFRTPELWSSVFFELFALPPHRLALKMRMLEYWLERGAAHPLTLYLHYRQPLADAVPLIAAQAARWHDVDLFLHPTTLAAFPCAGLQLPVLRRLSLGCLQQPDASAPITAFCDAPALTDVSLRKLAPKSVVLPWAQLTAFYCHCDDPADALRVLTLAPSLRHFTLDLERAAEPAVGAALTAPCVHEALRSLTIHTHPAVPIPVRALLAPLTLPGLRALELPPLGPADIDALLAFFGRSQSAYTLARFSAPLAPLPAGALPALLRALPALETLRLQYPAPAPLLDLLGALRGCDVVPRLRGVQIECARAGVPWAALLAALRTRWAGLGVARLRAFEMTVMPGAPGTEADEAYVEALRALKAQGMRVAVANVYQASVV